ncbi:hypothetical protein [Labilibaculum euxinus]
MRINNNINKNLKKSLFESPNPLRHKKEYNELKDFIFPSKELFIAFLDEENFEQQTFLAEKILLRLSYDSFFSPPTRLLFNVQAMESQISGEKKHGFIGRDHFVHMVHLYLLGVYMFLYHQIFNENMMVLMKKRRSKTKLKSNHLIRSTIKDFIVSLRYFVLFHDISYPIEYFLGNKDADEDVKKSFLKAFNNVPKSIGKDLSLRSLSKFIAVYKLVREDSDYTFENLIIPHIEESEKEKNTILNNVNFNQIEKVYGYETFRTVYSIFEKRNVCAVLYEIKSNLPFLIYTPVDDKEMIVSKTIHYKGNATLNKLYENLNAPYDKEHFQLKNYEWGFFINSEQTLEKLVSSIFPKLSFKEFDKTIDYIHNLTTSHYSMVISDTSFSQYCFDIYMVIYKLAGYFNIDDKTEAQNKYFSHLSNIINNIGKEIPSKVGSVISNLLATKLKDIDFESDMEDEENLEAVVLKYLSTISETYEGFANEISIPLKSEIQTQYELKKNLDHIRVSIGEYFDAKKIKNNYSLNVDTDSIEFNHLISKKDGFTHSIISDFNIKSSKDKLGSFDEVITYKPNYPGVRDNFFDHGVNSGLVFLTVIDVFDQLLNIKEDENFQRLLKVAIGIDIEQDEQYLEYKFKNVFSEVCYAIVTHNLYPKYLKDPTYRTRLDNNPFSYFAILIDSLQHWDRKFQVNQGFNELPYNTLSRSFNIEVKNNKIRISEYDARLDLQKSLLKLKEDINDYLYKASDYIELNLAEF